VRQQKWKEAIRAYKKAVENKLYTTPQVTWLNIGEVYMAQKDYENAVDAFRQAKSFVKQDFIQYRLGTALFESGKTRDAVSEFREGIAISPQNAQLRYSLAVVTNDIFTKEDAEFLARRGALPAERIRGVETGGCPHTAIREDASHNQEAIDELAAAVSGVELILLESGGDNLAATFSPELADRVIYVIDVAAGDKIPRKGGPGITRSDLLVINKIDLAPHVGADLAVMERDSRRMRGDLPFYFTNLLTGQGLPEVVQWVTAFLPQRA